MGQSPDGGRRDINQFSKCSYRAVDIFPPPWAATILEWRHLLTDDKHKDIIIESLQFLVNDRRIVLNAFVIMSNHIHVIWQPMFGFTPPSGASLPTIKLSQAMCPRRAMSAGVALAALWKRTIIILIHCNVFH